MSKFIVENCPCIQLYDNKATCKNGFHQCADCNSCVIKSIIEAALLAKCSCLACDDNCNECMMAEAIKMSNDLVKRLRPKIVEEENGD